MIKSNRNFNISGPTKIVFGPGELHRLHEQHMPGKKALIVISNGKSAKVHGILQRVENELNLAGVEYSIYDQIEAIPQVSTVKDGATVARAQSCDFILGLGGGNVTDASKAIAITAVNDNAYGECGVISLPVVTITTTCGGDSGLTSNTILYDQEQNNNVYSETFPRIAIIDPELTLTIPAELTANQGIGSLIQCAECYISRRANLISDMQALTAIEIASTNLSTAVNNGNDINTRTRMSFANMLSGMAMISSSLTSLHSLALSLSLHSKKISYQAGLIIISQAYFTHFINRHVCDDRFISMARAMGNTHACDPMDFIDTFIHMFITCGLGNIKMSKHDIKPEDFKRISCKAFDMIPKPFEADRCQLSIDDCINIYKESFR